MLDNLQNLKHKEGNVFFLIAGPCVIEDDKTPFKIAEKINKLSDKLEIPFIFKGSYKKANRSKIDSFTGIGDREALELLKKIGKKYDIPVTTDIHSAEEAYYASQFVDILQIPAFLCRQTDILVAAAKTGKYVNIKKGQFLSPEAMRFPAQKVMDNNNYNILLTERGTTFGYQDLLVDFKGIKEMQKLNLPVVLDITHSLQKPNQVSGVTGGQPEHIETLARAGVAVGVDGIFIETHSDPSKAKSDGASMLQLDRLEGLLERLIKIRRVVMNIDEQ
jgi:2-dehydro-3-deoxyphosphooctonate aldolase (KDO 8-P synthase)